MSDLALFLAVMGRLWWLWTVLIGGMVVMLLGEYREYKKEEEENEHK